MTAGPRDHHEIEAAADRAGRLARAPRSSFTRNPADIFCSHRKRGQRYDQWGMTRGGQRAFAANVQLLLS